MALISSGDRVATGRQATRIEFAHGPLVYRADFVKRFHRLVDRGQRFILYFFVIIITHFHHMPLSHQFSQMPFRQKRHTKYYGAICRYTGACGQLEFEIVDSQAVVPGPRSGTRNLEQKRCNSR